MGLKNLLTGGKSSSLSTTSNSKGHPLLKAHGYDSAIALEAPVRGSYPVAGNGPNVLDEIQRARARKDVIGKSGSLSRTSSTRNGVADTTADDTRSGAKTIDKPRINNGKPGNGKDSGYAASTAPGPNDGRTRSGFTTKSPPLFLNTARRNSLDSPNREAVPPMPLNPILRDIRAYQPKKATDDNISFTSPAPSFAQRERSNSQASHRAHVDLLEAHSQIRPSQESTRHRTKASGLRNYGEDVADRNIKDYGSHVVKNAKRYSSKAFDVNASEFSYLKSIYTPNSSTTKSRGPKTSTSPLANQSSQIRPVEERKFSNASAAPSPLRLGSTQPRNHASNSDDIRTSTPESQPVKPSLRSRATSNHSANIITASSTHAPATFVPGPLRSRPFISTTTSSNTSSIRSFPFNSPSPVNASGGRDDRSPLSNGGYVHSVRAFSPLSDSSGSVYSNDEEEGPAPPIPDRGRDRTAREFLSSVTARLPSPVKISNPVPVSILSSSSTPRPSLLLLSKDSNQLVPVLSARSSNSSVGTRKRASVSFSNEPPQSILPAKYPPPSLKDRKRTMSTEIANGQPLSHRPKSGSMSSNHANGSASQQQSTFPKRKEMLVENSKDPISLKGIVDISNTVDTTVTTKKLPAVVHEHVTPTVHTIREEAITREVHHHDVYHRILPVIETIILPTKHFIHAPDRTFLIELTSEKDILQYTGRSLASLNSGWKLVRVDEPATPVAPVAVEKVRKASVSRKAIPHSQGSEQFLDQFQSLGPYIHSGNTNGEEANAHAPRAVARDESVVKHEQLNTVSSQIAENSATQGHNPGPVLTSKRTFMTKEGFPRTEYFWRHPPVFEDVSGRTQPIYMRGIIGGTRLNSDFRSSSDEEDATGKNFGAANPKGEMFRDSGYGEYTALPGLSKNAEPVSPTSARAVGHHVHTKSASTSLPLAAQPLNHSQTPTPAVKSILKNGSTPSSISTASGASPLGSVNKPLPQSPLTSSPLASHAGNGKRIVDDEPGDGIQLGRVLDDERERMPRSSVEEREGRTGEATNFLRRLKEKRLSGDHGILSRFGSKGRKSMDAGRD